MDILCALCGVLVHQEDLDNGMGAVWVDASSAVYCHDDDGGPRHEPAQATDQRRVLEWHGYRVVMYRSPNTGDMVFSITKPEDADIDVYVNDEEVEL